MWNTGAKCTTVLHTLLWSPSLDTILKSSMVRNTEVAPYSSIERWETTRMPLSVSLSRIPSILDGVVGDDRQVYGLKAISSKVLPKALSTKYTPQVFGCIDRVCFCRGQGRCPKAEFQRIFTKIALPLIPWFPNNKDMTIELHWLSERRTVPWYGDRHAKFEHTIRGFSHQALYRHRPSTVQEIFANTLREVILKQLPSRVAALLLAKTIDPWAST